MVIVTAQQQPQAQQQNNKNGSWVETKESLGTPTKHPHKLKTTWQNRLRATLENNI